MNMQKLQQGFTLIELMTVVTIIGVLASVAMPTYQAYVSKSQFIAGLSEITPGKALIEMFVDEGKSVTSAATIKLVLASTHCSLIAANGDSATGVAGISCTLLGSSSINSKIIRLNRNASGDWSCETDVGIEYHNNRCTIGAPIALSNS